MFGGREYFGGAGVSMICESISQVVRPGTCLSKVSVTHVIQYVHLNSYQHLFDVYSGYLILWLLIFPTEGCVASIQGS